MNSDQKSASRKFEDFLLRSNLILLSQVKNWKKESACPFENVLLDHLPLLRREAWAEALAAGNQWPSVLAVGEGAEIAELNWDARAVRLRDEFPFYFVEDGPVLAIAFLNPFHQIPIETFIATEFPGRDRVCFLVTPHDFARLSEAQAAKRVHRYFLNQEERIAFAEQLGLDEALYEDADALARELWLDSEGAIPVLSLEMVRGSVPVPEIADGFVLMQSASWVWFLTPDPLRESVRDRIGDHFRRKFRLATATPKTFAALRKLIEPDAGVSAESLEALRVREWGAGPGKERNELGNYLYTRLLGAAIDMRASDARFQPNHENVRVRFRVNGDYYEQAPLTDFEYACFLDRCKLLGDMRADREAVFQDGSGWIGRNGKIYDLRMNVAIARWMREVLAIRISDNTLPLLSELRISPLEMRTLRWFLDQESGLFLSTGPTGSGKTTTLYALFREISSGRVNLVTVEDPVEKRFPDATQINIRPAAGITWSAALSSVLRQDPDAILIGEIRDALSARMALESASTGHQVFSTIHATDAIGVLERLVNSFDLDYLSVALSLKLSVAQRLVPRLCPQCKKVRPATALDLRPFPHVEIADPMVADHDPRGCQFCRKTGYHGRLPVLEMFPLDTKAYQAIQGGMRGLELRLWNRDRGYSSLKEQATILYQTGIISCQHARWLLDTPV